MARISPVQTDTDDPAKRAAIQKVKDAWGESWNVTSTIANNPKIIDGFLALWQAVEESGLGRTDREIICTEMARANGCHYCIPAHRHVARHSGVDTEMVERIASGEDLPGDGREATMLNLTRRLRETRGSLSDAELADFQAKGVSPSEMIAVIAEIAHCTITNFTNRLADTDLDPVLEPFRHGQPD
jgi:uncharacterized peroxidase-related enzyme